MKTSLYHAVLCPVDVKPSEDNIEHIHVVSTNISSALKYVGKTFPESSIVSIGLSKTVYVDGSIVDFE